MSTQSAKQFPPAVVPDRLFDDAEAEARWRARFHAPRISTLELQTRFLPHLRTAANELAVFLR